MLYFGYFTLKNINGYNTAILLAFSVLYTANIAVSNVSLFVNLSIFRDSAQLILLASAMVSVPFHQTVRALTPVFTITIYRVVFLSVYRTLTYVTVVPIILGVMLTSYGDFTHTTTGFLLTLLGTILAAIKTVTTNRLQTAGLHLNALELLYRMSIFAFGQSLVMAYLTNEVHDFGKFSLTPGTMTAVSIVILLVNGSIAFGLNVISFEANKKAGALTMTIAANVKQVLTVVLAVIIWHIRLSTLNAAGIILALVGGAWYAYVELMGKKVNKAHEEGEV